MPNCAVLSCKNSTKQIGWDNGRISFHRFPSDPKFKEIWIEATGYKNWFPTKHSRICSVHFKDGSFSETKKFRRLTKEAIPTIDVLKKSTNVENKDQKETANKTSPCYTPKKIKLEKDIHQPSTSNDETPLNTPKKKELVHKLNLAQQRIKKQNKQIKRLREQNRRKGHKILNLVAIIEFLKKKSFISDDERCDEQTILLNTE